MNLNETFIFFAQAGVVGNRAHISRIPRYSGFSFRGRPRAKYKRGGVSLVGLVCDDAALRCRLPLFILASETRLRAAFCETARANAPEWPKLRRQNSSWMNHVTFSRALRSLADSHHDVATDRLVVLLCECAWSQIHHKIAIVSARLGAWLVFVPS